MSHPGVSYALNAFGHLTVDELYECLRLRAEVFVVEQTCAYQDLDGLDPSCLHLRQRDRDGSLLGYARLVPPGLDFRDACGVGRIALTSSARGRGLGRHLVQTAVRHCGVRYPSAQVRIHAQTYLLRFYEGLDFVAVGERYLEDGIPHVEMELRRNRPAEAKP